MYMPKTATLINWGTCITLYVLFSWWHGAFERPLSQKEVDYYSQKLQEISSDKERKGIQELLSKDSGKPIFMINAIKMRETPQAVHGKEVGKSTEELFNEYQFFVTRFLIKRGSYPIYVGTASGPTAESWGIENADDWSTAAVVRYRSLRTLLEMSTNPAFRNSHEFKIAAIEKTIAYPTQQNLLPVGLGLVVFFILLSLALGIQLYISIRMRKNLSSSKIPA
ncbi:MAG: hypothetical protein AAGC85_21995 [Bacteroidota bacterium]